MELFSAGHFNVPQQITEKFAHAFLLKGAEFENKDPVFAAALCKILKRINICNTSPQLLMPYCDFFRSFVPTKDYSNETLRTLFSFARSISAPFKWLEICKRPLGIISGDTWLSSDALIECG